MNRGGFVRPASRRFQQHACHQARANLQTDIPQQAQQRGLTDGCLVTECGNDGMGRGVQTTPEAGRQRCGEERVGAGDVPPLPHEAYHLHVDAQALHDGSGWPMAHRIGGQGRRFHHAVLRLRDDQVRVLVRLASRRARAALGLRGMIRRRRAGRRRGWFDGGRTRASLQPCHRIPQILVFNPQDDVLSRQHLDDVQQLDHDLVGCQIGNAVGIEVRYLHMLGVYQILAPLSPAAQQFWRGYRASVLIVAHCLTNDYAYCPS